MPEDGLSDEFLIDAIAGKAMWALERLHERYSGRLYMLAYRLTEDHMVSEELVQDTFLAVWQCAPSYNPHAAPVHSWLFSITYHRSITYLRSQHRRSTLQLMPLELVEEEELCAISEVWEQTWKKVQNEELCKCLSQLPKEQRSAIELAYFEECTHNEIAQRCQIPLGTVKARIRLGILHLRRVLEKRLQEEKVTPVRTSSR